MEAETKSIIKIHEADKLVCHYRGQVGKTPVNLLKEKGITH